jgi:hypothetical protein
MVILGNPCDIMFGSSGSALLQNHYFDLTKATVIKFIVTLAKSFMF